MWIGRLKLLVKISFNILLIISAIMGNYDIASFATLILILTEVEEMKDKMNES